MAFAADMEGSGEAAPRRKRWLAPTLVAGVIALLVAYAASPMVALIGLVGTAQTADAQTLASRVDFPKLRRSVARQIVVRLARDRQLQGLERQLAMGTGVGAVTAYLEDVLTPELISDLMAGRVPRLGKQGTDAVLLPALSLTGTQNLLQIWWDSGFSDPVSYTVRVRGVAPEQALAIGLQLDGTRWQITSVTLPTAVMDELAQRVALLGQPPR